MTEHLIRECDICGVREDELTDFLDITDWGKEVRNWMATRPELPDHVCPECEEQLQEIIRKFAMDKAIKRCRK